MKRRRLTGLGAAVGAASAVTALLIGTTPAAAAEARPESAFALATQGVLNLGPIVKVVSPGGDRAYDELLGLTSIPGASDAGITAGLLTSEALAGHAASTVANLKLASLLSADLIKTTCDDGHGKLELVNASVLGTDLPKLPSLGQQIDLSPVAKVTLGEETRNPDGSITVTGIKLSVLPVAGDDAKSKGSAGLPVLSGLLGKLAPKDSEDSDDDAPADKAGLLNLPILPGTGGAVQTITIGSATCDTADGDAHAGNGDGDGDGDGDGHGRGDNAGDGDGGHHWSDGDDASDGDDDAPSAPAPKVVSASLPVTG